VPTSNYVILAGRWQWRNVSASVWSIHSAWMTTKTSVSLKGLRNLFAGLSPSPQQWPASSGTRCTGFRAIHTDLAIPQCSRYAV